MDLGYEQLELKKRVEELIDSGSHYKLANLEAMYSKDLKVVMVSPEGSVMAMDFDQVMAMFQTKKQNGEPPLDSSATFNYVEVDGDMGYVVVTRNMALMGTPQQIVFNITLSRVSGSWKVVREFAVVTDSV